MPVSLFAVLFILYISQGLPSGILAHVLPTLMADAGVAPFYIGLLKLLALPWALKFLWAPYVDRSGFSSLGPQRSWILCMQSILVALFFFASFTSQETLFNDLLLVFMCCLVLVNTAAATQDIATDSLAVRTLPEKYRGFGNSLQVAGFKVGMILTASLLLLSVAHLGWRISMVGIAAILCGLMVLALWILKRQPDFEEAAGRQVDPSAGEKTVVQAALPSESLWQVYKGFFSQKGLMWWLLVLVTYKLADSIGSSMIKPVLIDVGFNLEAIAGLTFWSSLAGLIGAGLGGYIYLKLGKLKTLFIAGVLQSLTIGSYYLVAQSVLGESGVYTVALLEQAIDGVSTVALFALMMNQCRKGHEGADYTVQASIQVVVSGLAAAMGGLVASLFSLGSVFLLAALVGVLSLIPVYCYIKQND